MCECGAVDAGNGDDDCGISLKKHDKCLNVYCKCVVHVRMTVARIHCIMM